MSPDGRFRLSRGNKGTLFVLVKEETPKERLLRAVAAGPGAAEGEQLYVGSRPGSEVWGASQGQAPAPTVHAAEE